MLLSDVVIASRSVADTSRRLAKVDLIAALLRAADPGEVEIVVPWLSGELRQRRTGVGWASVRDLPGPAGTATLTVIATDRAMSAAAAVTGSGSAGQRREIVGRLFAAATVAEQHFLRGLLTGELRQGALEGVMVDAVARAGGVPLPAVRRAVMLCGAVAPVAAAVLVDGEAALSGFRLQVGRALQPMLAATASSVEAAIETIGDEPVAVDWKLDGIRVQLHKDGGDVAVFTRSLDDITDRVPELIEAALALPVTTAVLDGEAIALRDDGRPRPFQETGARTATRATGAAIPLSWLVFDALHLDGDDVMDLPLLQRHQRLVATLPGSLLVPRVITTQPSDAAQMLVDALARGHEGVVVKSTTRPYDAGRRGGSWLKVKPVHTLDLVVLAAEWGSGRRRGWLSNLHLGARDPESGGFVMLGKTFKGLTDEVLQWQTERLQQLAVSRDDRQVVVAPELVIEIAFDGVQTSTRYPGGVTLRFARVVRYRDDKSPAQADTLATVQALLP